MKLSPVLSKYLAANKELSLPGIGTFYSEGAYDADIDGKRPGILQKVSFKRERVPAVSDELIEFISKETGKMKILAASDLNSQLDDVKEFMNTGKPYFFAGIGTLAKKSNGDYEFFAEKYTPLSEKNKEKAIPITEKNYVPQTYIDNTRPGRRNLKPAVIITSLTLIAIAATVWFYFKNQQDAGKRVEDITESTEVATPAADTAAFAVGDSTSIKPAAPDTYTYVLEVAKEPRASKRFNQLKTIKWPVELDAVDSLSKRIVMKLPAAGADTSRIKDSLRILSGRPVWIAGQ